MDTKIQKKIEEWTQPPFDEDTIKEIQTLVEQNNEKELADRFFTTLEFGTGGLRGVLGAGTNRMNIYTVGMATQGLANYIIQKGKADQGVVISYDSRRMSDEFSKDTAAILAGNGIKVYLFDDMAPTPLCSFAIRELQAVSGIMITASHNPPEYNGYKVYWDNGGQVIPPDDKNIIEEVNKIDVISKIKKIDYEEGIQKGLISIIGDKVRASYIAHLEQASLRKKQTSDLKIVYTPLHGAGYKIMPQVLQHFGFTTLFLEEKQSIPDGNFPTVSYPNPEEKEALELAVTLAKEKNADIILATDPDADRMGVGFKDNKGEYLLINGNQIGTMLEYYLLSRKEEEGKLPQNSAVIKTIVTTELQREVAEGFNCHIEDVLTGFKWIAAKMKTYDESGQHTFVFGGEESYGYLPVSFVRDKDAISACYFFCEMAEWLRQKEKTLYEFLQEIYIRHSLYLEDLKSITLKGKEGMEKIKEIMKEFRENPPKEFQSISVAYVDDIQTLTRKHIKEATEEKITHLPSSNVLQYILSDGTKLTMRPSGTEPKIKFYFSVSQKTTKETIESDIQLLQEKIENLKNDLVKKVEQI